MRNVPWSLLTWMNSSIAEKSPSLFQMMAISCRHSHAQLVYPKGMLPLSKLSIFEGFEVAHRHVNIRK